MTEPKPTWQPMTPAQVRQAADALGEREFWMAMRDSLLCMIDAIERRLALAPERRNVVLRKRREAKEK